MLVPIYPDYFAELYVAGRFAAVGWNVYFSHRDQGFDFILSISDGHGGQILRPVQVKGKYPMEIKGKKVTYGYVGRLTQLHPEMVLAIPYFETTIANAPICIAFMPRSQIKAHIRGWRCEPASFKSGSPVPRPGYSKFFDAEGLSLVQATDWG